MDGSAQSGACGARQAQLADSSAIVATLPGLGERRVSGGRPRGAFVDEATEERRAYYRQYQGLWLRNRRNEWIAENGPCQQCGSTRDLQVDHKEPGKKIAHRIWSWSAERLAAELSKCQVLCRRCHERKTALEFARLPVDRIVALRREFQAGGKSHRQLAREYGVSHQTVARIGHGRRFAWLTESSR